MDAILLKFFEDLLDDDTIIKIVELSEQGCSYDEILNRLVNKEFGDEYDKV